MAEKSRRRTLGGLVAALVAIGQTAPDEAAAARSGKCKPKCDECQRCQKGDCDKKDGKKVCQKGRCKSRANGTVCRGGGSGQGGRCIPAPTCNDGIKNGSETGVDCGGSCPRCANGQGCASRNDCASALCSGGTCQGCTESPDTCGDVNGAACFCTGESRACSNGVTSGPVQVCEACPRDTICDREGTKLFCAERCGAA